ncbi:MAG TPA: hypothetical protein VKV26_10490 [Dehalococcoidia bacterium]|nr:hypothetical protein [Dehalococcoidia bacterium]
MDRRLFRNPRLKVSIAGAALLATLGCFGLLRAQTPTRASSTPAAAPAAGPPSPAAVAGPAGVLPQPGDFSPSIRLPAGSSAPQLPVAPAPRPRPITRTRAS